MATIKTEICDLCLCPSKEDALFDFKITGVVNKELTGEAAKHVKDIPISFGMFRLRFIGDGDDDDDDTPTRKQLCFGVELCEDCINKVLAVMSAFHENKKATLDELHQLMKKE